MKPTKFNISDADGSHLASVHGLLSDGWLKLAHPYPDFDVFAGLVATCGDVVLTITGPRDGQRIPCTRG